MGSFDVCRSSVRSDHLILGKTVNLVLTRHTVKEVNRAVNAIFRLPADLLPHGAKNEVALREGIDVQGLNKNLSTEDAVRVALIDKASGRFKNVSKGFLLDLVNIHKTNQKIRDMDYAFALKKAMDIANVNVPYQTKYRQETLACVRGEVDLFLQTPENRAYLLKPTP